MDRRDRPLSATDPDQQHLPRPTSAPRGPSPNPSHRSLRSTIPPATPGVEAGGAAGSDYFATVGTDISRAPSTRSQVSNPRRSRAAAGVFGQSEGLESLRQPSIRIRRLSGASSSRPISNASLEGDVAQLPSYNYDGNRPRSLSQPDRAYLPPSAIPPRQHRFGQEMAMPRLTEEGSRPTMEELREARASNGAPLSPSESMPEPRSPYNNGPIEEEEEEAHGHPHRFRPSRRLWPGFGRRHDRHPQEQPTAQQQAVAEYDEALVDWLDTIDPEVQTLSTLTNVQNSLFVPDLGSWINRRPTYTLSQHQLDQHVPRPALPPGTGTVRTRRSTMDQTQLPILDETTVPPDNIEQQSTAPTTGLQRTSTITSQLTNSHYAALPHGQSLEGWTAEEKWELDDHVRHMLHSRRARMKRRMKGFGQYVSRPLGFLVTLYAVLITLFGLAWVLFMIGWIYVGDRQKYIIHVVDSVLVALFAIMGDGLAPFRAMDTYRLWFIVRYTRIIEKAKNGKFPRPRSRLQKQNIPPEVRESMDMMAAQRASLSQAPGLSTDQRRPSAESNNEFPRLENDDQQLRELEDGKVDATDEWLNVLTPKQRKRFLHHKKKMAKSHSFYKPQETFTHRAFPLSYLIAIVLLLDLHSCLQISLGATTWGIDYRTRNPAITTVILCLSITANITAGLTISRGDKISRKKDVVELLDRQALTGDAIKHLEKKRKAESGEDTDMSLSQEPSGSNLEQMKESVESDSTGKLRIKRKPVPEKDERQKLSKKSLDI